MVRKAIVNDAAEIAKLDEIIFEDHLSFDFIESDLSIFNKVLNLL